MNNRLFLSITLILGLSSCGILASDTELTSAKIEEIVPQIKANSENAVVNMNYTIDEASEVFGTPTSKEIDKEMKENINKEEKKRFWSSLYNTFFIVIPHFFLRIFKK
ncbi:hypothetical protein KAH94_03285 [bacterium]|nr:hypothetical protein [bacterium]